MAAINTTKTAPTPRSDVSLVSAIGPSLRGCGIRVAFARARFALLNAIIHVNSPDEF